MVSSRRDRFLALASILTLWAGAARASAQTTEPAPLTNIRVLFKLDPRLSGPTYGGERWLSPATFTSGAQEGSTATVEVKVQGVDTQGRVVSVVPEWTARDPRMVGVAAIEDNRFRITVSRAGESKLEVASRGISRSLLVKARSLGRAMQVEIQQDPPGPDPKSTGDPPPPDTPAAASPEAATLRDEESRNSYAVGWEMGGRLNRQIRDLDPELVARGLRDGLTGEKPLLTDTELKTALVTIQAEVRTAQAEVRKQLGEKNKAAGEAFLAQNKTEEGVVTLPSGLQYRVLTAGEGRRPTLDDTIVCHYRGTSIDGKEFDNSRKRNKPATLPLKRVVRGWSEALQLMPVGSTWQLFIPAKLAYGAKGLRGGIGPNETLVFEVELISIKDAAGAQTRAGQKQGPDGIGPAELAKRQ
jgi:FKBP-type peptidyl-prolyl cis-trans isomerase FklB